MFAAQEGHTKIVKLLKQAEATAYINSNLLSAAKAGDTAKVKRLLKKGADVSAKNEYGWTALMKAARYGHTETANTLLDAGADVNAKTEKGTTALKFAASKGHAEIVEILRQAGARE